MGARLNIYFGRQFAWLKYFTYHSVPVLVPDCKQHILSPAEVTFLSFFLCRNTPTNKNEVTLLSQLIFFSYYYADERELLHFGLHIHLQASIQDNFPSRTVRTLIYSVT
jgi:hypothetical protein